MGYNREKAISCLLETDIKDIMQGGCMEYLADILLDGCKGYYQFTDEELMQELTDRDISYVFDEEVA